MSCASHDVRAALSEESPDLCDKQGQLLSRIDFHLGSKQGVLSYLPYSRVPSPINRSTHPRAVLTQQFSSTTTHRSHQSGQPPTLARSNLTSRTLVSSQPLRQDTTRHGAARFDTIAKCLQMSESASSKCSRVPAIMPRLLLPSSPKHNYRDPRRHPQQPSPLRNMSSSSLSCQSVTAFLRPVTMPSMSIRP